MSHSILRWLIVIVAVVALVKFALGFFQNQSYDKMANGVMRGFSGLMDLQGLLGIIMLIAWITSGMFVRQHAEHAVALLIAVVLSHLPVRWKKASDKLRYRNGLIVIIVCLLLIVVGVLALPGNRWAFRMG